MNNAKSNLEIAIYREVEDKLSALTDEELFGTLCEGEADPEYIKEELWGNDEILSALDMYVIETAQELIEEEKQARIEHQEME